MNVVTIRVKGRRGVTRLPTRVDRPVQVPYSPPAPIVAPAPSCLGGAKPLKLPGWWLAVVRAREVSGLPLLGLPASQSDPVRPLAVPSARREALVAAGLAPDVARAAWLAVRSYRRSRQYARACLAQGEVVDLLTGEIAGPLAPQQRADAERREAMYQSNRRK